MFSLNCKGRLLVVEKPLVMGIINVTTDSFYSGSRQSDEQELLRTAGKMIDEGADIIDIGGQSTRPGSLKLDEEEELTRVMKAVPLIANAFPKAIISIDTFYARVAREAVAAGASIVNDISAGKLDDEMFSVVASLRVPYVLMHMKGTPANMQEQAVYNNVTGEVLDFFIDNLKKLRDLGVTDIIIDPGFGFGKTIEHNFELLRNLGVFRMLDAPLMAGLSRKSTIFKTLGVTANEALNGTTVLNTAALLQGAAILRVHDVREAREAVELVSRITGSLPK